MRILLVGHGCHPSLGSEPGLTWNWAWHLSSKHQVCVITHPWSREAVENYLEKHPNPNLHFSWVNLPSRWDPWNPARGERGLRLHYVFWQRAAFRKAQDLHQQYLFDLAHHVCWGTLGAPPLLWRLPIPFVWGPIGGGQSAPTKFLPYFGLRRFGEIARKARIEFSVRMPFVRKAARNSALVFATNRETAACLEKAGARRVIPFLDNGVPAQTMLARPPDRSYSTSSCELLWVGRLELRKALPLALKALAAVSPEVEIKLTIAGDGPERASSEQLVQRLGLGNRVRFLGWVPHEEMSKLFSAADVFLFTSLRDALGSVVLEAMAYALPLITLNHQGVGTFVPEQASIKVPVENPEDTVRSLAEAIALLANNPALRQRKGEAAFRFAESQRWDRRAEEMNRWYEEVKACTLQSSTTK